MKEVYLIIDRDGNFAVDISSGKGKVYTDKEKADKELEATNRWAKAKGYGKHDIATFEVVE